MKTILIYSILLFPLFLFAQERNITGKVTSSDGTPVPSVNVLVKNTNRGVTTDFDGLYSISASQNEVLVFSYVGLKSREIEIGLSNSINVVLEDDTESLEEVVLIGYGTAEKKDLTGSITSIKSSEILKQPSLTPIQSLQGKAAGLQIVTSGAPGSTPIVRIRGTGTVLSGRNPVYVVDGIITDRIDNINSDDILSMDILKDASSLAIYGTRGANGVVIVTTKSGKQGKLAVDISSYFGIKDVLRDVDMSNSESFANYSNIAFGYNRFSANQEYNTDWFDEITKIGIVENYNISVSGGSEKISAFASANYYGEEGILIGDNYKRLNFRTKVSFDLTSKLKLDTNISLSNNNSTPKPQSTFTTAYKQSPIVPVKYKGGIYDGRWGVPFDDIGAQFNNVGNPVASLELYDQENTNFILQGNIGLEYKIIDDIKINANFGTENGFGESYNFNDNLAGFLAGDPNRESEDFASTNLNTLTVTKSDYYHWIFDAFMTYDKSFNEQHNFILVLGTTSEKMQSEYLQGSRNNVPNDRALWSLNNGDPGTDLSNSGKSDLKTLRSYFARMSYDFDKKYFLTATIRRDGSSVFADQDENWGNFPSVGLGWVISNESFLTDSEFLSFLKLRGSWGELGNQNIPLNVVTFNSGLSAVFGDNQVIVPGSTITAIIDENVGWEVTEEIDFGLEFGFFNNRLSGEIDYYDRLNKNAILPISLPQAFGASGPTLTHAGKIRNTGLEFSAQWKDQVNDNFSYYLGGNITSNKNELEEITNEFAFEQSGGSIDNGQVTKLLREGEPIGSFYLLEALGFDERGEFVYNDLNDDGVIDNDDRQFFGSIQPDLFYGVNAGFQYKSWDFNIEGYGNQGNKVYNGKKAQRFGGENIEQRVADDFFTPNSTSSENPAPFNDVPLSSTYFLEDGDFFKINNITLGFTFTDVVSGIPKVRVYALAQNPFISQSFTGYTPELTGNNNGDPMGTSGIELDLYPSVKSYLLGININF